MQMIHSLGCAFGDFSMGNPIPANSSLTVPVQEVSGYPNPSFMPPPQVDIRGIWRALMNRKLLILIVTMSILGAVALYTFMIPATYVSTVALQIDPEAVKVLPYASVSDSLVSAPADFELYMKTQDELLRSPSLIARVTQKIQEKYRNPNLPTLKGGVGAGISIFRIQGSQIARISYESYDPDFSALTANTLAEEFIKLHFERKVETTRKAGDFLQNQLRSLKEKVERSEAETIRYAARHGILETGASQQNIIRERLGQLNTQVTEAEREYLSHRAAYQEIQKVTVETFLSRLRTPEIANLEAEVFRAEQELSTLLTQFGENWPPVIRKRNELAVLQKQLRDLKSDILAQAKRDAENQYIAALSQHQSLSQTFQEQQQLVNQLNEASIKYNTLKRDADAGELLYQGLLQRLKETGISAALEFGNIHIIDPASPWRIPYRPRIFWNLSGIAPGAFGENRFGLSLIPRQFPEKHVRHRGHGNSVAAGCGFGNRKNGSRPARHTAGSKSRRRRRFFRKHSWFPKSPSRHGIFRHGNPTGRLSHPCFFHGRNPARNR
jgi:uncharacterized protein involved in exopolysaccharide biosynthesis